MISNFASPLFMFFFCILTEKWQETEKIQNADKSEANE